VIVTSSGGGREFIRNKCLSLINKILLINRYECYDVIIKVQHIMTIDDDLYIENMNESCGQFLKCKIFYFENDSGVGDRTLS